MKHSFLLPGYYPAAFLWLLLLASPFLSAQYYFYNNDYRCSPVIVEAGCSAGVMNSLTDLGGKKGQGKGFIKDLSWKMARPAFSAFAVAMYRDRIGLKLVFTKGAVAGDDGVLKKKDPDLTGRYGRHLSFRSRIMEVQLAAEIHPLFFTSYDADQLPAVSPYFLIGIGWYHFNPEALLNGQWHALHPLRLEGQGFAEYPDRKPYQLRQFDLPFGAGIKCKLHTLVFARLEIGYRKLFTDYLDDVSTAYIDPALFAKYLSPAQAVIASQLYSRMQELQPAYQISNDMPRGDHKNKDAFFSIELKIGITIRSREN